MAQYAQYGVYEQAGYGGGYGQQYVEQPAYGGYAQQEAYPAPQLYTEAYPQAAMPVEYEYVVQQPPQMMAQPAMVSTMPVYEEPQVMPMTPQRQMPPPQPQYEQYSAPRQVEPQTYTQGPQRYYENGGRGKLLREPRYGCCGLVLEQPGYYEIDRDRDMARNQPARAAPPPAPPVPTGSYFEEGSSGEAL
mmetsp:Transcript_57694/g.135402  ORF Transcript_57694/g.135402 Transcript_57694/m.135402 type:complete len:190 (-) Transcript_57694:568-1137(-)|eukprot:CAMPEP_0177738796 /NCGR_PEP_ID=MMETSP0484_2-20121128/26653_1 /TAXON_ID=354590 /ORGANISM="Rhodomonas lens, Strain RHODO" /LENGTH=189 /DNA_ID=CAMNT_0019252755 /DNA_START=72 /DNA_END=641 /DNA_ORIENTATION=+